MDWVLSERIMHVAGAKSAEAFCEYADNPSYAKRSRAFMSAALKEKPS